VYQVLIVDDEPEIRLGLRLKADWEGLGLAVAGEAANGSEALERLAGGGIDIVITDMNMPVMNGVSFLEACRERYPGLKMIVLTGYEDFDYARAAIRSQAKDYLLKPVSQSELTAALTKVKQELDEERSARSERETVQWRLTQYYLEMKEHFILHLVKEEPASERWVRDRAKMFELDAWAAKSVRFLTAGLRERGIPDDPDARTPGKLRLPFEMLCREFAGTHPEQPATFRDSGYPGLIHFILRDDEAAAASFARELKACIGRHLGFEPAVGAGQPVSGFKEWKQGYLSSLLAWNLTESKIRSAGREPSYGKSVLTGEQVKVLRHDLIQGELESFEAAVREELTQAFLDSQVQFVKLIFQLYLLLDSTAEALGIRLESEEKLWIRPELARELDTVEKAAAFLVRLAKKIRLGFQPSSGGSEQSVIHAAERFIRENYMDDIHLTLLAERFNYNPSYFSEWFKAKTGKTFIQYVTEVRMEHAVRLLAETKLPLWDIAELTGFSNPSYFSSKFKKIYGMSPSEYRQASSEKFDTPDPKK